MLDWGNVTMSYVTLHAVYLVGDLDKHYEDDKNKQVVKDADSADDDVDHFE